MDSVNRYYGFGLGWNEMKLVRELSPRRQGKVLKKLGGDARDWFQRELSSGSVKKTNTQGRKKKKLEYLPNTMKI